MIRPGQELVVSVKGRDKHHGVSEHDRTPSSARVLLSEPFRHGTEEQDINRENTGSEGLFLSPSPGTAGPLPSRHEKVDTGLVLPCVKEPS